MAKHIIALALMACSYLSSMAQQASVTIGTTTTNYSTLSAAVEAASNANATAKIVMLSDVENLTKSLTIKGDVFLDLNGHTISACIPQKVIIVSSNGMLTVTDRQTGGRILHYDTEENDESEYATPRAYGVYVMNGGTFDLEDGTIEVNTNEGTANSPYYSEIKNNVCCLYLESNTVCSIYGGTVKTASRQYSYGIYSSGDVYIAGGTIDTYATRYSYGCTMCTSNALLTVDAGEITTSTTTGNSTKHHDCCIGIYALGGEAVINDGIINSTGNERVYGLYVDSRAKATVNNGKFLAQASINSNFEIYGESSNITLNGGIYAHDYFLKKYAKTKYVNNFLPSDARYKAGYCCGVSDQEDDNTIVALNLSSNKTYKDLLEAINSAEEGDTIVMRNDYTLAQDFTIPAGVTLLLPCDNWNTRFTQRVDGMFPCPLSPATYHTLTIADGKTLTANGSIVVAASLFADQGGGAIGCGSVQGNYGAIKLMKDANIIVNDTLYCWGYIHGEGTVTINKGGKLCEIFNLLDWRGGDRSTKLYTKFFPVEQYQVQNVESKLVVMPGANTYAMTCMEVEYKIYKLRPIYWIGGTNDAFFTTGSNTTVTRTYDGTTDRITYDFDNSVSLGDMYLDFGDDLELHLKDYRGHLMDNWTFNIKKGTFTVPYKYNMLPGCKINIEPEAEMVIESDANINLFDKDQWNVYSMRGYICPAYYTIANGTNNRAVRCGTVNGFDSQTAINNMTDASIDVQGKITVNGSLTATESGAKIISSGDGIINYTNATGEKGDSIFMVQKLLYTWDGYLTYPAPLCNANGTTFSTKYCSAGTTFAYEDGAWRNTSRKKGDVNGDGNIDILDVNNVISFICNDKSSENVDVNGDGNVDILDVNTVIGIICGE